MANKQFFAWLMVAATAVGLTACHEDVNPWGSNRHGSIAPSVTLNAGLETADKQKAPESRAVEMPGDVEVEDLSLTITKTDGTFTRTWEKLTQYDLTETFAIGEYDVEAYYGDPENEGFGNPAFYGSQTIVVKEDQTTAVSLTAEVVNSLVSIRYTDAFRQYMTNWDATLHTSEGHYIFFAREEARPAYLIPGTATLNVSFTTQTGHTASLQVTSFDAKKKHHHTITVDMDENGGSQMVVTFDDTLDQKRVVINISDEILDSPAPTVKGDGSLQNGSLFHYIEGDTWTTPLKANIIAQGGLASVTVSTTSSSLFEKGWPREIDLMTADAEMQSRLRQLGFDCKGLWNTPDKMAVLDFTGMIELLRIDDDVPENSNDFTISVTDKNGKVCEDPFSFAVHTIPLIFEIGNPTELSVGNTELSFDLTFNGSEPSKNISFQYKNERGTWDNLVVKSFTATDDDTKWRVTLTVPGDSKPLNIRGITKSEFTSNEMEIFRVAPKFALNILDRDVWARHALLTLTSDEADANMLTANATYYISVNDGAYNVVVPELEDNTISLQSLTPNTKYTVKASANGDPDDCCDPVEFTTEANTAVPNGNFDNLYSSVYEQKLNQGGKWSVSAGINYQSYLTYTISVPTGWASVNKKTTCSATRNSWFVVPSTFNSSLTWSSTVPAIKLTNTGGGTETPESYSGFTARSGQHAMVLRNVAWDPAGTVPGVWRKEFAGSGEYYNHTEPNISRVSAGKLYLGGPYTYDRATDTETYKQGKEFTSRPTRLNGYYRYINDPQDLSENGTVTIEVLNGTQIIARGSAKLGAADAYTQFQVPLTYIANAPKATSLRIMFTSSDKTNESDIQVSTFNSRYESAKHGATLVVDNLTFTY